MRNRLWIKKLVLEREFSGENDDINVSGAPELPVNFWFSSKLVGEGIAVSAILNAKSQRFFWKIQFLPEARVTEYVKLRNGFGFCMLDESEVTIVVDISNRDWVVDSLSAINKPAIWVELAPLSERAGGYVVSKFRIISEISAARDEAR